MKTILSLFMAFILAFTASDSLAGLRDTLDRRHDRLEAAGDVLQPVEDGPVMAELPDSTAERWEDVTYVHYDPAAFNNGIEVLTALAGGTDGQALLDQYDALCDQFVHAGTMAAVAYIRFSGDVTDQYWSDESVYSETLAADMQDALLTACHQALQGPCAGTLRDHVGPDVADIFEDYAPMSDRESELMRREAELVDRYYELMNTADDATYSYMGQTWTFDMINGFQGTNLAYQDYEGYLEVFYGLQKAVSDQVGPLFTELAAIRAEEAELAGYGSYADMAYEQFYLRDYSCSDAQALCDAVKPLAREYYASQYYADAEYDSSDVSSLLDEDALIQALGQCVGSLDGELMQYWEAMTDRGLFDIGFDDSRQGGSYTTYLPEYGFPFVFSTLAGDCFDLSTLTHEFGHFISMCRTPQSNAFNSGNYDLLEIPSTALEALGTFCYDDVYGPGAPAAKTAVLCGLMESVIDGCIFDELQRDIYARPDMTADDISALYADISAQYGVYEPTGRDYYWVYVPHNFDVPLYYISYAVSALAAIQIWDLARTDLDGAVRLWEQVMDQDPYTGQYMAVLAQCGLRPFTEDGAAEDICAPLMEELTRLSAGQ